MLRHQRTRFEFFNWLIFSSGQLPIFELASNKVTPLFKVLDSRRKHKVYQKATDCFYLCYPAHKIYHPHHLLISLQFYHILCLCYGEKTLFCICDIKSRIVLPKVCYNHVFLQYSLNEYHILTSHNFIILIFPELITKLIGSLSSKQNTSWYLDVVCLYF